MVRVLAAFIFFTRLPFWRLAEIPSSYFKRVVPLWPLTGWLTAGITVLVLYGTSLVLPASVALIIAFLSRLLITGGLHEDGLADFIDGLGGGRDKQQILSIMKDSHIGTYGVLGLIFYFGLLYTLLSGLPIAIAGSIILAGDPFAKTISAMIINRLPYARDEQTAKNKTVYSKMSACDLIFCLLAGLIPLIWLPAPIYLLAVLFPVLTWVYLTYIMDKKIQGYTGDCCGALFLLCELSFYLGIAIIYHSN